MGTIKVLTKTINFLLLLCRDMERGDMQHKDGYKLGLVNGLAVFLLG